MPTGKYDPDRDITPTYLATVRQWIAASGEVLVVMRYLRAAGSRDFALVSSAEQFDRLVDVCPVGTDIIVFRDPQLPLRGVVDETFLKQVESSFPHNPECLVVEVKPKTPNDPRCSGQIDHLAGLKHDLEETRGEIVAIGECPDFCGPDNDGMISASKGGIDGPR